MIIASKSTIMGCKKAWPNTAASLNLINGKTANSTQKIIKKSIIEGFGLIRCFKIMLRAKKYLNLPW